MGSQRAGHGWVTEEQQSSPVYQQVKFSKPPTPSQLQPVLLVSALIFRGPAAAHMKARAPYLLTFRHKKQSQQLLCEIYFVFLPSQVGLHNDLEGPFSFACHRLLGSFVLEQGGSLGELVWPSAQSTPHFFPTPSSLMHRLHVRICRRPTQNQGFSRTSPHSFSLATSGT